MKVNIEDTIKIVEDRIAKILAVVIVIGAIFGFGYYKWNQNQIKVQKEIAEERAETEKWQKDFNERQQKNAAEDLASKRRIRAAQEEARLSGLPR